MQLCAIRTSPQRKGTCTLAHMYTRVSPVACMHASFPAAKSCLIAHTRLHSQNHQLNVLLAPKVGCVSPPQEALCMLGCPTDSQTRGNLRFSIHACTSRERRVLQISSEMDGPWCHCCVSADSYPGDATEYHRDRDGDKPRINLDAVSPSGALFNMCIFDVLADLSWRAPICAAGWA